MRERIEAVTTSNRKFKITLSAISLVWYLALFPGRLGFDYSEAIRIMRRGESTDWWTASFWWFLKLSTFDGQVLFIASAISLLVIGYSLFYLSESLSGTKKFNRCALIVLFCSPLYGGFGLNVSHDVFIAAAIIIFTGFQIRCYKSPGTLKSSDTVALILGGILAVTTQYGPFVVLANLSILIIQKNFKPAIGLLLGSFLIIITSNFGVTNVPTYGLVLPILADMKCVVQHPEAEVTEAEWSTLTTLAPKSEWTSPTNCSMIDDAFRAMPSLKLESVTITSELIKTYFGLSGRNSAIVAMAHFQRASIALPPPFFSGPQNQVILDPNVPIGAGTNTALQSHAGVLHPSIDEPSVAINVSWLRILEIPAQGLIFIVNQASWFWGWGGLWLWPVFAYLLLYLRREYNKPLLPILGSTLVLHGLLLILSAPLPRYVMSTILLGNYFLIIMVINTYSKISSKNAPS